MYSIFEDSRNIDMFNLPKLVRKSKSILKLSEKSWPPAIAGTKFCRILCCNGRSKLLAFVMVQIKCVNSSVKPPKNAACANSGSVSAIFDKTCSYLFKLATKSFRYLSLRRWLSITAPRRRMPSNVKLTLVFAPTTVVVSKYLFPYIVSK